MAQARIGGNAAGWPGAPSLRAGLRWIHITRPVTAIAIRPREIAAQMSWLASPK
ncbi:hypothetical protein D3C85_1845380 [compost metagenome]